MDGEKTAGINQWLHPYAPSLETSHPGEAEKLFNISLGYEVLPFPGPRKIMHKRRPTNLGFPPASKRRLWDIAAPFLSVTHVTETFGKGLGKEQKTLCKRLLALRWNITMIKDFLAGLTVEWHPLLLLELSSINKLGLNNGTFGNLLPELKNFRLRPDISQGSVVVIVTISSTIVSHILYRSVSHFLFL